MNVKEIFANRLRATVQDCHMRGLYQASQWAAEQLLGLEPEDKGHKVAPKDSTVSLFGNNSETVNQRELGVIMLSLPLMAQGQYQRVAFNIRKIGQEMSKLSKFALFLYAYSQYLAGEKLKNQQKSSEKGNIAETKPKGSKSSSSTDFEGKKIFNTNLPELYKDLLPFYAANKMDGYLLYIFAVIVRDLLRSQGRSVREVLGLRNDSVDPLILFQQALVSNPWNWSAWLDFEEYCIDQQCKIPTWDEMMANATTFRLSGANGDSSSTGTGPWLTVDAVDKQCGRAIYALFLSHYHLEQHRGDLALPALEKLQKIFPSSLFLVTQIGVAHYAQRVYDRAEEYFVMLRTRDPYRLQHLDTYSNILYVHEKTAELALLAHHVVQIDKYAPEVCCVIGNHYSLRGHHEKAATYFQRALRSHPEYLSAWTLLGHEYMELRNTVAAIQCYRHGASLVANKQLVIDGIDPRKPKAPAGAAPPQQRNQGDFRAWYGLGQTYEMLHCHQYALFYYQKAAELRPDDARMWSAVGNSLLRLHLKAQAMASYERAVYTCQDREGVATRDLARLYKEEAASITVLLPGMHDAKSQYNLQRQEKKNSFMLKAAETYYRYLLASNANNQNNIWPILSTLAETADGDGAALSLPSSLEEFFAVLKEPDHPLHAVLVAGDDITTGNRGIMGDNMANSSMMIAVDAEQAEALLFLASYYQALRETAAAQNFCSKLLSYSGPEGDQARLMLRDLRAGPASFLVSSVDNAVVQGAAEQEFDTLLDNSSFLSINSHRKSRFGAARRISSDRSTVRMSLGTDLNLDDDETGLADDALLQEDDDDTSMVLSSPVSFSLGRGGSTAFAAPSSAAGNRRQSSLFQPMPSATSDANEGNSTETPRRFGH